VNYESPSRPDRTDPVAPDASRARGAKGAGAAFAARPAALLQQLLRHAAEQRDVGLRWDAVDKRQIEHTVKAGFAPLLWRVAVDSGVPPPASWRDTLHAADLVAQVFHGNACDATVAIVDACHAGGAQVTLLKGVSIGEHYPAAHLRPMGDVDLLVARRDCEWVESTMVRGGYVRMAGYEAEQSDAHGTPLFEPELAIWVEIHTGLFPEHDRLRANRLFAPAELERHTVASTFRDRRVGRLRDELQLVYIASYWIRDMSKEGLHASFARPLFDAVYLLRARGAKLDWEGMVANLDNEGAAASLYALLRYLSTRGYSEVPAGIVPVLEKRQNLMGPLDHAVFGALVDACLVGTRPALAAWVERHPMVGSSVLQRLFSRGSSVRKILSLPWAVLFPPHVAGRYTWQYQLDRWRRLLGRVR